MMIAFTVGHPQPADLQRMRIGIGPVAAHQPVHHLDRHRAERRQRRNRLLVTARCLAKSTSVRLVELALPPQRLDRALGGRVIARRRLGADLVDTFASTRWISACSLRLRGGEEPLLHHFGRLEQKVAEQLRRNVRPKPDLLGQRAVASPPA